MSAPFCGDERLLARALMGGIAVVASLSFGVGITSILLHGCGPAPRVELVAESPAGATLTTPRGTHVEFPAWLDAWPALEAAALAEVDATAPGVPAGWRVRVHLPRFYDPARNLLVVGMTDLEHRVLHVGWRVDGASTPLLPALSYEEANAIAGREVAPLPSWVSTGGRP